MKPKKKNFILIGPLPPPAVGQSLSFQMLCRELENKKYSIKIIDIGGGAIKRRDGAFSIGRTLQFVNPFIKFALYSLRRNQTVYLTIAQSWNGFLRDFIFIMLAVIMHNRIIVHLKGGNYNGFYKRLGVLRRLLVKLVLSRVATVIVLAECLKKQFEFLENRDTIIKVVHNGLPEILPDSLIPKTLPVKGQGTIQLLYLSNMIESKGYLHILDSVCKLKTQGIKSVATFCGEFILSDDTHSYRTIKDAKKDFFNKIEKLKISESIQYKGSVKEEMKKKVLEQAHFFILPTMYINEGQPISIIEAMAYGCVVISTNYRAIPEMLNYGKAGIILDRCHGKSISEKIQTILTNPTEFATLSENALSQYRSHFSKDVHIQNMLKILLPGN